MSTTEQLTPKTDDLACSLVENVVISSSDPNKSSLPTCDHSNPNGQATSTNVDTEVKQLTQETDIPSSKNKDFHLIKWIEFNFEQLPILLQNVNGPCPLLAIFNILLLRKRVKQTFFFRILNLII